MFRYILIVFIVASLFFSCGKDNSYVDTPLYFSEDTIHFDTVFTTIGTTSKELRVKNRTDNKLTVDEIYLAGGESSYYRLNIDGEPVSSKNGITIDPGDSIYIFIDVIIDPSNQNNPVAVADSIIFRVEDKFMQVQLLAWGQDINLLNNETLGTATWNNLKPFVIYGKVKVDTGEIISIDAGARIYFHRGSSLKIYGSLLSNGTAKSPVTFASDRLEKDYIDIPGQWDGIYFSGTSSGNIIDYSIIRNSIFGIALDGTGSSGSGLTLLNSTISHSTVSAITASNSKIVAANCIFYHCGKHCIYLTSGGDYSFTHCTVSNLWDYGLRLTPSINISEGPTRPGTISGQILFSFLNSVIYGDLKSEIEITATAKSLTGNYLFDHCLVKLDTINAPFWSISRFPSAIVNKDPRFINPVSYDYRPDTLSPLIDNGSDTYKMNYPLDIRKYPRISDEKADIGAYERIPGEKKKER